MYKFEEIADQQGRVVRIKTAHTGKYLLAIPEINKGSAFTREERHQFGLLGKLPDEIETIEQQVGRYYAQYQKISSNLEKNNFLNRLKQHNNTAFYRLVMDHLEEMLPLIYTPTIGEAVMQYSFQFDLPRGLHFSYSNRGNLHKVMDAISYPDVDLIIVTDGEGVLGLGDWGVGGIDICVGKLMVYTLCGGVNPRRVLAIQIDVGTNNETLLNDPMYLGLRHPRITGEAYDAFITGCVEAIRSKYPSIYLHWEDFSRENARRNLERFKHKMCTFNDDMQGTGATATACIMAGLKTMGQSLGEQNIVFFGAGTAGVGIADQLFQVMVHSGMSEAQARERFWLIDRAGLLFDDMDNLAAFQRPYACKRDDQYGWGPLSDGAITLQQVVERVKPTILIGCSAVPGAFTQRVIEVMAEHCARPIIFPLSNPTSRAEAVPQDVINWSQGRAIIATGSPFPPVTYQGREIPVAQCNNAFIFPGLGLGVIACKAHRVTEGMIQAACRALSDHAPILSDPDKAVLPGFSDIRLVSQAIALAVVEQAVKEKQTDLVDCSQARARIKALSWVPEYIPYEKA